MELRWINENQAEVVERPEVTLSFAKFEDNPSSTLCWVCCFNRSPSSAHGWKESEKWREYIRCTAFQRLVR